MRCAAQNGFRQIVDSVDVFPGSIGGALGGFDQVEVNAVRPEILATFEHDDAGGAAAGPGKSRRQALALGCSHGAIVKIEGEKADLAGLPIANVLPGGVAGLPPVAERHFGQ